MTRFVLACSQDDIMEHLLISINFCDGIAAERLCKEENFLHEIMSPTQ